MTLATPTPSAPPSPAFGYYGSVPGPTWRVRPGDRLQVTLVSQLGHTTNLHTHGLFVSPDGNGDNPFIAVEPGQRFDYDIRLPEDHPPGLYWYHPHHHGMVADQVFAGLYGAIIVEDPTDLPVTRERVLVISDITLDAAGDVAAATRADRMMGREGETVLVNGQVQPVLRARPGERERWRVVNACVSRYPDLRVPGQYLALLGMDSARTAIPTAVDRVLLAPGNRADLIVPPDGPRLPPARLAHVGPPRRHPHPRGPKTKIHPAMGTWAGDSTDDAARGASVSRGTRPRCRSRLRYRPLAGPRHRAPRSSPHDPT